MEHEESSDDSTGTEPVIEDPQIEVSAEATDGAPLTVDDLEVRLELIESAMQQLQEGDIEAAEQALLALDGTAS